MLRTIEMYTNEYKDTTQKEIRKKKGQFFTPAEVSMRMAAVESEYPKNQWIRVLDPGAGNGILSFAVIDKLLRSGYKRLDITLIETDKEILPVLEYTITKIRQICESYHAECFMGILLFTRYCHMQSSIYESKKRFCRSNGNEDICIWTA